jgi:hypothetical protein
MAAGCFCLGWFLVFAPIGLAIGIALLPLGLVGVFVARAIKRPKVPFNKSFGEFMYSVVQFFGVLSFAPILLFFWVVDDSDH